VYPSEEPIITGKEIDTSSPNNHTSTQSPKSMVTEKKSVSISELQNKFFEQKRLDIQKQKLIDLETPKFYSNRSEREAQTFHFSTELRK
jgi:hypothetical protein